MDESNESKIHAAVCYELGQPLSVEELTLEGPKRDEVYVRLKACAICHSDISLVNGDWAGAILPSVAGHEAAGIVCAVGDGVDSVAPGDHVVVTLVRSCGQCGACRAGHSVCCNGSSTLDNESRLRDAAGNVVTQGLRTAAFAEACVVHESQLVRLPKDMPFVSAALLGCGVITGFCSVTNVAAVEKGSKVAVIGTGGLGLNTIQGAVLSGAAMVVAIDVLDSKLDAARRFGATHTINALKADAVAEMLGLSAGGADYVFVATGNSQAFTQSILMLNSYGASVILGMPPDHDKDFVIDSHVLTSGRKVLGSKLGETCIRRDIPQLVDLYQQGKLRLDELVSKTYAFSDINAAVDAVERGEALRNVVVFD